MSRLMIERRNNDKWRQAHGELTATERQQVIDQIKRGDKYMDIALDWLISEDTVQRIASREGLYRRADKVRLLEAPRCGDAVGLSSQRGEKTPLNPGASSPLEDSDSAPAGGSK